MDHNAGEARACGEIASAGGSGQLSPGSSVETAYSASYTAVVVPPRMPFTSLSQADKDIAIARLIQQQERAYMMLQRTRDYADDSEEDEEATGSSESEEYELSRVEEEDEDDEQEEYMDEEDPVTSDDEEEYPRALLNGVERGPELRPWNTRSSEFEGGSGIEDHNIHSQDGLQEMDNDEYSYEELMALCEVVGTECRGLSADTITSLPSVHFKAQDKQENFAQECVICLIEFEDCEALVMLPCKHAYHSECIAKWLQTNKVCPLCSTEVSKSDAKMEP